MPRTHIIGKPVRLTVTFDAVDYKRLSALAKAHGLSAAWMIRKAVSEFVSRQPADGEQALLVPSGQDRT